MTTLQLDTPYGRFLADTEAGLDISIPLVFNGPQPNHFGAPAASAEPLHAGEFTGDTRAGGSCNCERYHFVAHCNGTHTECVGHVTDERIAIRSILRGELLTALLMSVEPVPAATCAESTSPPAPPEQSLITRAALRAASSAAGQTMPRALVIRTLPNEETKLTKNYLQGPPPPCFSSEAMEWVVDHAIDHLLVDIPSLDQMYDEGMLTTHRIFWGLPAGARTGAEARRPLATVTEMVYAPDSIPDGQYLLNLQVPPFMSDAAPSRPVLYPLERS